MDLAARGMPPEHFYQAAGELFLALPFSVDIVDMDETGPAMTYLMEHGDFQRVA